MNLTKEEQEIVDYIESGDAKSVEHIKEEITKYTKMEKDHLYKKKLSA